MRLLFTLSMLIFSLMLCAQKVHTKVDKFTGDTTYYTKPEMIYSKPSFTGTVGEQLRFTVVKFQQKTSIIFYLQTGKTSLFSINSNDDCSIKLEDGNVINLKIINDDVSDFAPGSSRGSSGKIMLDLSDEDISKLKASSISAVRINTSSKRFDYDIKSKNKNDIQKALNAVTAK